MTRTNGLDSKLKHKLADTFGPTPQPMEYGFLCILSATLAQISDIFDLCLYWVSVALAVTATETTFQRENQVTYQVWDIISIISRSTETKFATKY